MPATLPSDLLQRRPDVRSAQAALRSAAGQQRLSQLAFFPTFTFIPGLGWSRIEQPGFSTETQNWSIGGSVMQPVLSIPRLMSELKVAERPHRTGGDRLREDRPDGLPGGRGALGEPGRRSSARRRC